MSPVKIQSHILQFLLFLSPLVLGLLFLPFSLFVKVNSIKYSDVCLGEDHQMVTINRDVRILPAYTAVVWGEAFMYRSDLKIETTIKRKTEFVYQKENGDLVYKIKWNKSFSEVGEYGASDLIKLNAFGITKTKYFNEDDQRFNVVNCD